MMIKAKEEIKKLDDNSSDEDEISLYKVLKKISSGIVGINVSGCDLMESKILT